MEPGYQTLLIPLLSGYLTLKTCAFKKKELVWIKVNNVIIVSCYLTPSDTIENFNTKLNDIEDTFRDKNNLVIGGDLNSKAVEWGSNLTNPRGIRIIDMAARMGLSVANVGNTPTFRRPGCQGTIPDITLVSERIANNLQNWTVLEDYNGSDHNYITFTIEYENAKLLGKSHSSTRKWNLSKLNRDRFLDKIRSIPPEESLDARYVTERTMQVIQEACNASMPKIGNRPNKTAVYWWTNEISELRKHCNESRRKYTRARRTSEANNELATLKKAKKDLNIVIKNSKTKKWEELRNDLNKNPWGLGYKIVMKKLGGQNSSPDLPKNVMENIVQTLFPQHEPRADIVYETNEIIPPPFTEEELEVAVKSLKKNKSPGPDGIPSEILKIVAEHEPHILLTMYNCCLKDGLFPEIWKRQHLVLIGKGKGDPETPSAYRPLCMLDTAGKLLERLLKPRISKSVEEAGGLSKRQYGFRPKMSTLGAIQDVIDTVKSAQNGSQHSKKISLLATLDVRNAFNSARWIDMIEALEVNFKTPAYIMKMIRSYLKDRKLIYQAEGVKHMVNVTSGAAQGSILGPELWNISYDGILNIDMPPDTYLVGYADDVAAVISGRDLEELQRKLNQVMLRTKEWLDSHGLKLATEKTELVLITGKHIPLNVEMRVLSDTISTQSSVKYLGLRLDNRLNFTSQLESSTTKAAKISSYLSRLMANIGGPTECKRRLLMSTTESILLYGAEIWGDAVSQECRRKLLGKVQRTAALRVSSAYRTVSEQAILVISRSIPIDLLAEERKKSWVLKNSTENVAPDIVREETLQKWQSRWNTSATGRWTAKLIPNVKMWINRKHGETNYYLTQMLSGHGYFQKYLHKMGKTGSPTCIYEDKCIDDAEHTFFDCERWKEERLILQQNTGTVTLANIVDIMLSNEENWKHVSVYVECVLRIKKQDLDIYHRMEG